MARASIKQFVAKVGIDFDGFDPSRVEPGDPIPDKVDQETIKELLAIDAIEEKG